MNPIREALREALSHPDVPDALVTVQHEEAFLDVLTPVVGALAADAWQRGYLYAYWQERGYPADESSTKPAPSHLTDPDIDTDGPGPLIAWNPYR